MKEQRQDQSFSNYSHLGFPFVNEKMKSKTSNSVTLTYRQYGHFGEVVQCFPLSLEVLDGAHKHNVFELMVVKIASTERHHQVPEANQG